MRCGRSVARYNQRRCFRFHGGRPDPMSLRTDALCIWQAGVDAVRADGLLERTVRRDGRRLFIAGEELPLGPESRLAVVGAGKAGAGMALGLERAVGDLVPADRRLGWVNVPADCVQPTDWIHLHAGRPAGVNAPTREGVAGTRRILQIVAALQTDDVCIVLLSGGGSALLTAPADGIALEDKQAVTRLLSERGASIEQLNCVRRQLSDVKGGGLLRACRAGRVRVLMISDVVGDPLETIASGPTVPDPATASDALDILRTFAPRRADVPEAVWARLESRGSLADQTPPGGASSLYNAGLQAIDVRHHIIANNATACRAAAGEAARLGYDVVDVRPEERGVAREVGVALAEEALALRAHTAVGSRPRCLITGGEPVVQLAPGVHRRRGGRNQELVLAALARLWDDGADRLCLLSGGTDGEDGPTDAAGALLDADLLHEARRQARRPEDFLARNNSYPYFESLGGLLKTGPTHTNVMDLRVALIAPAERNP